MAFKQTTVIAASAVCALILVSAIWYFQRVTPHEASLVNATPTPQKCSAPVSSFCPSQNLFADYVTSNDFSDILGSEQPITVTCTGTSAAGSACAGIGSGLTVDTYTVVQNGTSSTMSRNSYITLFLTATEKYGPFKFVADTQNGTNITMQFASGPAQYSLLFNYAGGSWKLKYPTLTGV